MITAGVPQALVAWASVGLCLLPSISFGNRTDTLAHLGLFESGAGWSETVAAHPVSVMAASVAVAQAVNALAAVLTQIRALFFIEYRLPFNGD